MATDIALVASDLWGQRVFSMPVSLNRLVLVMRSFYLSQQRMQNMVILAQFRRIDVGSL